MNWYKIRVNDGSKCGYTFVGCASDSLETLGEKASRGEYLRLDDLLYWDRGEIKEWEHWNKWEVPDVYINPANIIAIQPFKGDPRIVSK